VRARSVSNRNQARLSYILAIDGARKAAWRLVPRAPRLSCHGAVGQRAGGRRSGNRASGRRGTCHAGRLRLRGMGILRDFSDPVLRGGQEGRGQAAGRNCRRLRHRLQRLEPISFQASQAACGSCSLTLAHLLNGPGTCDQSVEEFQRNLFIQLLSGPDQSDQWSRPFCSHDLGLISSTLGSWLGRGTVPAFHSERIYRREPSVGHFCCRAC